MKSNGDNEKLMITKTTVVRAGSLIFFKKEKLEVMSLLSKKSTMGKNFKNAVLLQSILVKTVHVFFFFKLKCEYIVATC